ncbi:TPA: hypothetical protein O0748_002479 [Staphylococcus aureus]|jgi:hypothetical protein|nr:hypothetical protein [Staphylococcus aureus]HCY1035897.1 hypothetical protein [Staphylococcus aureus]HDC7602941.1 hypothetical protein [Staphylococcus aureus]HEP1288770.1 hypothetical protein [Staphylococcus aureus]
MNYKEITTLLNQNNPLDVIKAIISYEKGITDNNKLSRVLEMYMEDKSISTLFDDRINDLIDEMEE